MRYEKGEGGRIIMKGRGRSGMRKVIMPYSVYGKTPVF